MIYLSISLIDEVAEILRAAYGENAACAVAFRVSQPEEKIMHTTLNELSNVVKEQEITHQALIIVGKVLDISTDTLICKSKLYDKNFSHGFRDSDITNDK